MSVGIWKWKLDVGELSRTYGATHVNLENLFRELWEVFETY